MNRRGFSLEHLQKYVEEVESLTSKTPHTAKMSEMTYEFLKIKLNITESKSTITSLFGLRIEIDNQIPYLKIDYEYPELPNK